MNKINNPILPGFNPDPSIIRVKDDYYIATSTFEWFPGVQIHHSKDLVNWTLLNQALTRKSQLDLLGVPDSGGVWAPCLSYSEGTFYLVYTIVKSLGREYKDTHNYLVTTDDINGEWSEPIFLNSYGFDPSLFHDDGKKYLVYMKTDNRVGHNRFGGIFIQEYSVEEGKVINEEVKIFAGTKLGFTEGAHIYKRNGYYYLMTAEGGTSYGHATTFARSKNLFGPYEVAPNNPILTSRWNFKLYLQKSGHSDLVETVDGDWYLVHLCSRPIKIARSPMGRETAIQKVKWTEDDWLVLDNDTRHPSRYVDSNLPLNSVIEKQSRIYFDDGIPNDYQTLRVPINDSFISNKERPGYLRLIGQESLSSTFNQTLLARRQQSFVFDALTLVEFEPNNFKHMAGLIYYYNTNNYYYLTVTHEEGIGKCIKIIANNNGDIKEPLKQSVPINNLDSVYLKASINYGKLQFYYGEDESTLKKVGKVLDASKMSDEYVKGYAFTGSFIGMCCQDLTGFKKHADFRFFEYIENDN